MDLLLDWPFWKLMYLKGYPERASPVYGVLKSQRVSTSAAKHACVAEEIMAVMISY